MSRAHPTSSTRSVQREDGTTLESLEGSGSFRKFEYSSHSFPVLNSRRLRYSRKVNVTGSALRLWA